MVERITIGDNALEPHEWDGQRVVTFEQIGQVHGVPVENVRRAFQRHVEEFIKGEDYFRLDFTEANQLQQNVVVSPNGMTVFTEAGYLLLTKPMKDKLAWRVTRVMRSSYFQAQQAQQSYQHESEVDKLAKVVGYGLEKKVDKLQHTQDLGALQQRVSSQLEAERKQTNTHFQRIDHKVADLEDKVESISTVAAGPHPSESAMMVSTVFDFLLNKKHVLGLGDRSIPRDYKRALKGHMRLKYQAVDPGLARTLPSGARVQDDEVYRQADMVEGYEEQGGDVRLCEACRDPRQPLKKVPPVPLRYAPRAQER